MRAFDIEDTPRTENMASQSSVAATDDRLTREQTSRAAAEIEAWPEWTPARIPPRHPLAMPSSKMGAVPSRECRR